MSQEKITKYDHKKIEQLWKEKWYADNIYEAVDFSPKPKKYILAELPYPSGKSLHVGHAMRYTVPEMYSRFLRMKGYNVMFPMGWDAFGLPTEMYAIKNGVSPQDATKKLAIDYKKAFMDIGYGVDWNREINTTDPEYYKWTQWLFLKFYENGLAEYKDMPVWYSQTAGILADEEVINGENGEKIAERDGSKVERKMFKQWVLKIPAYTEKLLEGLNQVDFPESIKSAQINWIGKKEGINITYKIKDSKETVTVFTTRPDTNFGATFVVIAPEHPLVERIIKPEFKTKVMEYARKSKNKSELERMEGGKNKSGEFTGSYAINGLNGYEMPIYVADYVLMGFGTGVVVGVPGHDRRDFEFAGLFNLPVVRVVVGGDGDTSDITKIEQVQEDEGTMINSSFLDGMDIHKATQKIMDFMVEKGMGERSTTYKIRDWIFSRQRYWGEPIPVIHTQDGKTQALADRLLPLELPYSNDYTADSFGTAPLGKLKAWIKTQDKNGQPAERESQTMPTWAGSSWYFLRYIDPHNDKAFADFKKMKYWLPVDKYFGGAEHTTVHLLYSRFWHRFLYDLGLVPCPEPYQWRMNGGLMLGPDGKKMSKRLGNIVEPGVLIENYGADATRIALAFIGPYSDTYPWNENTIKAMWRLVKNIYDLKEKVVLGDVKQDDESEAIKKSYNKLVKNVTEMCNALKMNTAISEIMIFVNDLKRTKTVDVETWKGFIKVIAPFMPFVAEELWQEINNFTTWDKNNSIHWQSWPKFDKTQIQNVATSLPIMINGKIRGQMTTTPIDTEETIRVKIAEDGKLRTYLQDKEIKKLVFVTGKIVSIQI
ncbi:MAG: leucine--tRNA ligase [Patescibacteria group bacterium]